MFALFCPHLPGTISKIGLIIAVVFFGLAAYVRQFHQADDLERQGCGDQPAAAVGEGHQVMASIEIGLPAL